MGLRFRVGVPGPYVGPVPSFVDLLRTGCRQPALGPRYVVVGSSHGWSFTYWSVAFGGARGVQGFVPCPSGVAGNRPSRGRRGSRRREAFGTAPSVPLVTRWTDRRIEWRVRQAQGRARPLTTVGRLAARWGVPRFQSTTHARMAPWAVSSEPSGSAHLLSWLSIFEPPSVRTSPLPPRPLGPSFDPPAPAPVAPRVRPSPSPP